MAEQLPVPTTTAPIASPTDKMYSGDSKGTVQGGGFGERSVPGSTGTLSPSVVNQLLMEFLMYFGRALLVFYPVYLTGYLGLSVIWILLCMMLIIWWKKNRKWKDIRIGTAMNFLDNETQVIHNELKTLNMATWVHFPEVEKVDWLNKIMLQAWPFFGMFMEKLLKEKIQPSIRLSSPYLKTFTFTKVHFGHTPLRITGLKVYTHEVDKRQVVMDLHISYDGDVDIDTEVKPPITAGVKSIRLQGMLRVILEPLIGNAPLVGGVTMFFIRRPTLQINWTGLTNLLDTPGLSHLSEPAIMDIIASLMVLPNRMCIPLIDQVKVDQMRFPLPRGVVRVHLLEARDLIAKDTYMMGMVKGKSDPYAVLRVGNIHFQSKTIQENLHPRWNEVYEFVVHEAPGQELEVDVFDEDTDKDDILGKFRLDFGEVKKKKEMDKWFPLDDVSSGEVHLKLQWLSLQTDPGLLVETSDGCACAMLAVYLDNASNLPVKEHDKKTLLGTLNVPLSRLLNTSDMTLDQRFLLERSGANSQIKMKATLRILTLEKPEPQVILNPQVILKPPPQPQPLQNPPTTSPTPSPSPLPSSYATPTAAALDSSTNGTGDYVRDRHGSFLAADGQRTVPSTPAHIRRFDSQSLLSENSIASSRFDLTEGAPYPDYIMNHQGTFGEIQLTVRYVTLRSRLIILVNSCRNLFACSKDGSDAYVRLYLLPDQSWKHRMRTQVKKKTVTPVFNEKFELDMSLEEAGTRKLDVAVKNNRMFHTRERKEIGMVQLDLSQMDLVKGFTEWYELTLPRLKKTV
uniref:Extended synaptotagmin-like protein 3 n=1 Tax=Salmo trutta TaxID=8032 RepID=A0A674B1R1_SALTR